MSVDSEVPQTYDVSAGSAEEGLCLVSGTMYLAKSVRDAGTDCVACIKLLVSGMIGYVFGWAHKSSLADLSECAGDDAKS